MNTHSPQAVRSAAGWHGKLPTLGDFATRRLDSDFVNVWDNWISSGLAKLRTRGDGQWLEAYLGSPTWRFLLTPNFLPAPMQKQTWAGVVMPSVDRVGRYYPLTIAWELPRIPLDEHARSELWSWFHRLEDLAVDAMQEDWTIDAFEEELERIGVPLLAAGTDHQVAAAMQLDSFFGACGDSHAIDGKGRCVWYSESDLAALRMMCSYSLDDSILGLWTV